MTELEQQKAKDRFKADFNCLIKDQMEYLGMSQKGLANAIGKDASTVNRRLKSDYNMSVESMVEIIYAIGYKIEKRGDSIAIVRKS